MNLNNVILKYDSAAMRDEYGINSLVGTVNASSILKLIDIADLQANPREAKVGKITDDIIESISDSPELFHFKTKGLLVSAGACVELDRQRFRLTFDDPDFEGILDGGHNLLAIAMYMISVAAENGDKALRGKRRWEDVRTVWDTHRDDIENDKQLFDFLVPVEVLFPKEGAEGKEDFEDSILEIAQARNNNAELTRETKANKKGLYDAIKDSLDPEIVDQIEWKTNDGGRIKARDIVALALVPLSRLPGELPGLRDFRPVSLYRYKGGCVTNFNDLMSSDKVSKKMKGDIRELSHAGVRSGLKLLRDLPRLVDLIQAELPEAYNSVSPGFGRIAAVRLYEKEKAGTDPKKYLRNPPKTKYYRETVKYDVPEGFITPIVWGLTELMHYDDGKIAWLTDPDQFIKATLPDIMRVYHGVMSLSKFDPQNVAKVSASYELVASQIKALVHSKSLAA